MKLDKILNKNCVQAQVNAASKKRVLELISKLLGKNLSENNAQVFFNLLVAREKIGSTTLGHGVALPHICVENIERPAAAFLQLTKMVDFSNPNEAPVDLVFALAVPEGTEEENINLLTQISKRLADDENLRTSLREAKDADTLYQLLTQ